MTSRNNGKQKNIEDRKGTTSHCKEPASKVSKRKKSKKSRNNEGHEEQETTAISSKEKTKPKTKKSMFQKMFGLGVVSPARQAPEHVTKRKQSRTPSPSTTPPLSGTPPPMKPPQNLPAVTPFPDTKSTPEKNEPMTLPPMTVQPGTLSPMPAMSVAMPTAPPGTTIIAPPVPLINEKWVGEPAAQKWLDKIEFKTVTNEFISLQNMDVDVNNLCKKWKTNMTLNQSAEYPALDDKLIKCPDATEYVNMTKVDVPLGRSIFIGQLPKKGSEETFWKAFFEARITYLTIINEEGVDFFPNGINDFRHYGSMFVNNRRVENINEDVVRFVIEVLPNGFSNSIMSTVTVIKNWTIESVHNKQSIVVKEILEMSTHMNTAASDEAVAIISKHGAGRAGYFAALLVAIGRLEQKNEPNIPEVVKNIRAQRPKAVESITQYVSLYITLFYYIKKKTVAGEFDKKEQLHQKCVELTAAFYEALATDINDGKSTFTVAK